MKGFKAFGKGMICRGKQYAENSTFEEAGAETCCSENMMHFCETPFDCLDYYPLVDENGELIEIAEVEALDKVVRDGNKRASKKIKIGAKLSFRDFLKIGIQCIIESTKPSSSGDWAKIGSSGNGAKIGSSGNGAQIGSSGNRAQIGSSGNRTQIGSSGDWAKIGSSGDGAQIGSSGYGAKVGSSGDGAKIGSSGNGAQIGSSGDGAKIGSSGDWAQIGSSGDGAVISAIGVKSMIKAKIGSWITLAEYDEVRKPICVKSALIDGENLLPDVFYTLRNGEFVPVPD
nr:MAG TPA: hypothetical protein [Caudoviricetes sp.]